MNLYKEMNNTEIELLKSAGIEIENKDYNNEDLKFFEHQLMEFVMSASSKNGDIDRRRKQYDNIFRTIDVR